MIDHVAIPCCPLVTERIELFLLAHTIVDGSRIRLITKRMYKDVKNLLANNGICYVDLCCMSLPLRDEQVLSPTPTLFGPIFKQQARVRGKKRDKFKGKCCCGFKVGLPQRSVLFDYGIRVSPNKWVFEILHIHLESDFPLLFLPCRKRTFHGIFAESCKVFATNC